MAPVLLNPFAFATGGGGGGAYATEVLADSPAVWWRLGDASGTTMVDSSGNGRDGTYAGSPTLGATGLLTPADGTAVSFNGSSQNGKKAIDSAWMLPSAFTVEMLIKPTSTGGTQDAFAHAHTGLTSRWMLRVASNQLQFYTWSGSAWTEIHCSVSAGVACHIACTYDASVKRIYKNGTLIDTSGVVTVAQGTVAAGMAVASTYNDAEFYGGVVDEAAFYPTALSGTRIAAHSAAAGY